jgi:hypothetical protein
MGTSPDGIYVLPPRKDEREVFLSYSRLDALWKSRDLVTDRNSKLGISKLNTAVNRVLQDHGVLESAHRNEAQYWAMVCVREQRERDRLSVSLADEEADEHGSDDDYIPLRGDRRLVVKRQIRARRGQRQFRDTLRKRHGDRCLVTSCTVLAVLEAAHISPFRGERDNHPDNGLLLRADIHTLFDLNLLGIEPERFRVSSHRRSPPSAAMLASPSG